MENKVELMTRQQSTQMHALLSALGMMPQKRDILSPYEVQSSNDLTTAQATEIINSLLREQQNRADKNPAPMLTADQKATKRARAALLAQLETIGIKANMGSQNAYWARVNTFLKSPRIGAKVLYQMTIEDCQAVIAKIKKIAADRGEAKSDDYGTH